MKEKYFIKLKESLKVAFDDDNVETITNDYIELFEDYLTTGMDEEEVIAKLGDPNDIVKSIIDENKSMFPSHSRKKVVLPKRFGRKLIAAMPFLSLIIFLVLGFTLNAWHPGWLVFLMIPMSSIIFTPYKKGKIIALSPFVAVIIFILIGTYVTNGYKYAWTLFLLIPLFGVFFSVDNKD